MRWAVSECRIVGGMAPLQGKAPFDRAGVVLERVMVSSGYLQVRAYIAPLHAEGPEVSSEEWSALLASEHALRIEPPFEAAPGAALWVMRPSFTRRDAALEELRASGHLLGDVRLAAGGVWLCVVREPDAYPLRDAWAERATATALRWARADRWTRARDEAELALVLERGMSPERVAFLSLAYERCGNPVRAGAYLEMARRSRGDDFAAQVREMRDDLGRLCDEEEALPRRSRWRSRWRTRFRGRGRGQSSI